jgi:hypothetical protein
MHLFSCNMKIIENIYLSRHAMCIESLLIYHVYHMIKFETMDEKNYEKN